MVQIPPEVLSVVFQRLVTLELGRMPLVSREWNLILSNTTSLWRSVEIGNHEEWIKILQAASTRSNHSLESIKIRRQYDDGPIISILQLSKHSLRKLDVGMRKYNSPQFPSGIIAFFRSFPRLERLNLTTETLPEVDSASPAKLRLLAMDEAPHSFTDEDLRWLSTLKYLLIVNGHENDAYKFTKDALDIVEVCRNTLVELRVRIGTEERIVLRPVNLPNLRALEISHLDGRPLEGETFSLLQAPLLNDLCGSPLDLLKSPFMNLESLRLQVSHPYEGLKEDEYEEGEEFEGQQLILLVQRYDSTLKEIQLLPSLISEECYSIDPLLLHFKPDILNGSNCRSLCQLYVGAKQNYSKKLLAEVLLSRRLTSTFQDFYLCANLTLYLEENQIDEFRAEEEKVLSQHPEWMREAAGRAEVKRSEEWRKFQP